jgi:hypothetical protein
MSLNITPQISGQQANGTLSYCFINEPLKVHITDSDSQVSQIFADITKISTSTGVSEEFKSQYILRDITSLGGIAIDLMKVVKQLHDFDVYHFSSIEDIVSTEGKNSVVSKYIYKFEFYTDEFSPKVEILKLPILGGRTFENFIPSVDHTTPIRETNDFSNSYLKGFVMPTFTLRDISSVSNGNYTPYSSNPTLTTSDEACEGRIVWKSKLGSWMSWGMNLKTAKVSGNYSGSIDNGMFESTDFSGGGNAYIPVNYTSVMSGSSITLKCLSLTASELIAVAEINGSPAVYYQKDSSSGLELMKLTSATAPIKTHINGGDFSVSLSGLFSYEHRVK